MISYRGYVYLIGSSRFGWYKIGKSRTAAIRVQTLGILLPFKIEVFGIWKAGDPSALEVAMHCRYAEQHINGEWFSFSPEQLTAILGSEPPLQAVLVEADGLCMFTNLKADVLRLRPDPHRVPKPKVVGGLHAADWIKQYFAYTGLERTPENLKAAGTIVGKMMSEERKRQKAILQNGNISNVVKNMSDPTTDSAESSSRVGITE